jgi:hypothetical protein
MQYISQELISFIRAILFGVAVGYAAFYFLLYSKPMVEGMIGVKKLDVDYWSDSSFFINVVWNIITKKLKKNGRIIGKKIILI